MKLDRTCIIAHSWNWMEHADMWSVSNNSPSSGNGDALIPNFQNIMLENTVPTLYKIFYIVFCIIFTNLEKIFNNLPTTASMGTKLKKFQFIIAIEISYIIWTQLEINNWIKFKHLFYPKGQKNVFYQKKFKNMFLEVHRDVFQFSMNCFQKSHTEYVNPCWSLNQARLNLTRITSSHQYSF